ncbi:hypothetical protein HY643_04670 [Candidatus Woesearchaeota archaeon]|nr:hypothetical protein [Candidatus Woesearchaeota archaeon]
MGLEKIFQKQELIREEKLQIINTKESELDKLLASLLGYFNKTPPCYNNWHAYYTSAALNLKGLNIPPEAIQKINENIKKGTQEKGLFLSALIQTSYNQGNNYFEFETINADCFGAFLEGKKGNKLTLKIKKLLQGQSFVCAKHCRIEISIIKDLTSFGWGMRDCQVYFPNKKPIRKQKSAYIVNIGPLGKETNQFIYGNLPQKKWD